MTAIFSDARHVWKIACMAGILWLAGMTGAPVLAQKGPPAPRIGLDRAQLEIRLNMVATLIEKSSGARQVEASGDARSREMRENARQIFLRAKQAFQAGDDAQAAQLLPEAAGKMFEAVRLAAPEQLNSEKESTDFRARLESVKVLLAAQKRIGVEKSGVAGNDETTQTIEKLLAEAERIAATGDVLRGRVTLDQAYLIAKAAITSMRSGDTLVRTLHFSSKEDEYHYEIDRNDTHRMLIQVLLAEKRNASQAQNFIDKARELRVKAEAASASRDYAEAIRLLEESTRELVRAIRGAGVYIPG